MVPPCVRVRGSRGCGGSVAVCACVFVGAQYLVSGVFSIPYFNITEPLRVVYDGVNHRERIDYYHGMDTFIYTPVRCWWLKREGGG